MKITKEQRRKAFENLMDRTEIEHNAVSCEVPKVSMKNKPEDYYAESLALLEQFTLGW